MSDEQEQEQTPPTTPTLGPTERKRAPWFGQRLPIDPNEGSESRDIGYMKRIHQRIKQIFTRNK